jgi:hypothetical protein
LYNVLASSHKIIFQIQTPKKAKEILKVHLTLHSDMLKGTGSRDRFHKVTQKGTYLGPKQRSDRFLNFSDAPSISKK